MGIRGTLAAKRKYRKDKAEYNSQCITNGGIPISDENPQLFDYYANAGRVDEHYFLQDIYVAKLIGKKGDSVHYDIGSRVDGLISHLLTNDKIREINMIDIRPLPYEIEGLNFIQADATHLDNIESNSIQSLSCLHAIEHFGLGRYGDRVDSTACFDSMKAMSRVLKPGGTLYVSCPISKEDQCVFNAHRIFSPKTVLDKFENLIMKEFSVIHNMRITSYYGEDAAEKIRSNELELSNYDCGIFIFSKQ